MDLKTFFTENPSVALAFSGGTDSSYLLYAGLAYGANIRAYYVKTAFQPQLNMMTPCGLSNSSVPISASSIKMYSATKLSQQITTVLYCKTNLYCLAPSCSRRWLRRPDCGTNAQMRPATALVCVHCKNFCPISAVSAESPRRMFGYCQKKRAFYWDKPSMPVLATRIPAGTSITAEMLKQVNVLKIVCSACFKRFPYPCFHVAARIQLPAIRWGLQSPNEKNCSMYWSPILNKLF